MTRDNMFNLTHLGPGPVIAEQAHAFVEAGIPIFPVFGVEKRPYGAGWYCTCGRGASTEDGHKPGKHPAWAHGHLDAVLMDDIVIADNFLTRGHNLAYRTGNGLVVIDVDKKNGGLDTLDEWEQWTGFSLPTTLMCRTGGGGLHLIYRYRVNPFHDLTTRPGVLPGVDVKGKGGYCIAVGSRHISGQLYSWVDRDTGVAWIDEPMEKWLFAPRMGRGGTGLETPRNYDYTQGGVAGQRDAFFNDLAFRSRKEGLSWDEALRRQRSAWENTEQPEGDVYSWTAALNKLDRVWQRVQPDDQVGGARDVLERWNTARLSRRRTGGAPTIMTRERRQGL